jgi:protoporphyrinogen/coproporphyrinogen III oxidase
MRRVVIIGGGITGLATAYRLLEKSRELQTPIQLTLLESSGRLGGIVQTAERDGFLLERGPDSFISEKPAALNLVKRLGLESRLIETNSQYRRSFVVNRGRLLPVPEGFQLLAPARFWPFVKSGIFSPAGKVRMTLELLVPRRAANGTDESLADFVRRRFGREALERIAQPMVGGIYTADPEKLSLRATMPRFLEMEREHGSLIRALRKQNSDTANRETSGARYSLFLSFDRGMQVLTDELSKQISGPQVSLRLNTAVNSIAREPNERTWKVTTADGETFVAEAVCLALPAYTSAQLLGEVDAELAAELNAILYASSATINLAYRREDIPHALDGFGFVVPAIEGRSLIACSFSSVKFAGRAPADHVLLRAFVGGALQPEALKQTDDELLAGVQNDLRELIGVSNEPLFAEVARWERSMPQYHLGHLERVKRIDERLASLPGLTLAGNAFTGLGISDCIRTGEAAAEQICSVSPS